MSSPARTTLVVAGTAATPRPGAFPADEPLRADGAGRTGDGRATRLAADRVVVGPEERCRQTAALVTPGHAPERDARWAEQDHGAWRGRTPAQVDADGDPLLRAWLRDPCTRPPHGEELAEVARRVEDALADLHARPGTTLVVAAATPVRVALLQVLGAPLTSLWHLDTPPWSRVELRARTDGGWTFQGLSSSDDTAPPPQGRTTDRATDQTTTEARRCAPSSC